MRFHQSRRRVHAAAGCLLFVFMALGAQRSGAAPARMSGPAPDVVTERAADFGRGAGENVVPAPALHLDSRPGFVPRLGGFARFGLYTSAVVQAAHPFSALQARVEAGVPPGTALTLDVRTADAAGRWSPWQPLDTAGAGGLALPWPATTWQYRLTLDSRDAGPSPQVQSVRVETTPARGPAVPPPGPAPAGPVYRVFATREGLQGQTTANGHVITYHDHFVALPSTTVLNCNFCYTYHVTLYYHGHVSTQPAWDVGPWNTHDNYWHLPRAEFGDLVRGLPEAQAAYQTGYNNGRDEFGRPVLNPAGIDLADGVFWDDLGMTNNDWVILTYDWEQPVNQRLVGPAGAP